MVLLVRPEDDQQRREFPLCAPLGNECAGGWQQGRACRKLQKPTARESREDFFRRMRVRQKAGWHVTTRVAWLASVGGCAFSAQPLLHIIPSVSHTPGSKLRVRPSARGVCPVLGLSRLWVCLVGLSAYAKRNFLGRASCGPFSKILM